MTYFKTRGRPIHDWIDPRRIEAAIESPSWWRDQVGLVADRAPAVDLGGECAGIGPGVREIAGFVFEVKEQDQTEIVDLAGITGLALGQETEVRLPKAADVVDLGIAHDGYPPRVAAYAGKRLVTEIEQEALRGRSRTCASSHRRSIGWSCQLWATPS